MKFGSYNLDKDLVSALAKLGYINLTPIQEKVIKEALRGKSIIAKSQTGSGKTHAFLIPVFAKIDLSLNKIQALIVSPTSELAAQTYEFARKIDKEYHNFGVKLLSNGNSKEENLNDLNYFASNPRIVIGTPGRIIDVLLKNKNTDKTHIQIIVLDECDMLLDESHIKDIEEILYSLRPDQRLAFTATMKEHQIADTYKFIGADEIINIDANKVNTGVKHHLVDIKHVNKTDALINFLNITNPYFTLVFASTKTLVNAIFKELNNRGIKCALISGEVESRERKNTMKRIRNGEFNLVICSDIASRGIDLDNVSTVVSLDLPEDLDYYYHRSGRCGRNGNFGDSYVFYDEDNLDLVNRLINKNKDSFFDYYVLRKDSLKLINKTNKKKKEVNENLNKEIRKEIAKVRTKKVKPGYKKKIKMAVKKAKDNHKEEIIKKNLREKRKANAQIGGYGKE